MDKTEFCAVLWFFVGSVRIIEGGVHEISYSYPQPQPPFFDDKPSTPAVYLPPPHQDEIPQQISPTYLPPSVVYPPIGSPPEDEIQPPFDDTIVIPSPPPNLYLPPVTSKSPMQVYNMSCLDTRTSGTSGYFRTFLRSTLQSRIYPTMENSVGECAISPISTDTYAVNLEGANLANCGVRSCGNRMCLTLRMATVPGLKLLEDSLVTLQCVPQETVVSHTKHLRLNAQTVQGRSNGRTVAIASGGNQRHFEIQANLLRRRSGSDIFDQPIQQGSAVRLGDELLLRTAVRDGDGWKSCRMGSVIIRSTANQKSVTLVDDDGCRRPAMRSICPQQPQQISPLVIQLPFKAFLFQGASPADDLLLSVRMSACLLAQDCYQNRICEDHKNRIRRAATLNETTKSGADAKIITDLETQFHFRVVPEIPVNSDKQPATSVSISFPTFCFAIVSLILAVSALILGFKFLKNQS